MRIAVLISGEYREFPVAHQLWSFLKWPNVDVYFATWNKTKKIDKDKNIPPETIDINDSDILTYVNPIGYKILDYDSHLFTKNTMYYNGAMIFLWQEVIRLMEEQSISYDWVFLIRPDLGLEYDDQMLYNFLKTETKSDDTIFLINSMGLGIPQIFGEIEVLSDLMIVGTHEAITKLKNVSLAPFESITPLNLIDIHKFLAKEFIEHYKYAYNLPIYDWCIVRSTSHNKFNQIFDVYKQDSKIWWETYYQAKFNSRKNVIKL